MSSGPHFHERTSNRRPLNVWFICSLYLACNKAEGNIGLMGQIKMYVNWLWWVTVSVQFSKTLDWWLDVGMGRYEWRWGRKNAGLRASQSSLEINHDSANNSTLPRYSKKLAASPIICVWTYKQGPRVIWLDLESNTNILDKSFEYLSSQVESSQAIRVFDHLWVIVE